MTRRQFLTLTACGVVAYFTFLVAGLPATVASRFISGASVPFVMFHTSGTLWTGRAERFDVAGFPLGRLEWRTRVLDLLRGHFMVELDLQGELARFEMRADKPFFENAVYLHEVRGSLNEIGPIAGRLGLPSEGVSGEILFALQTLRLDFAGGIAVAGRLSVSSLTVPELGTLGHFTADCQALADASICHLADGGDGHLALQGELSIGPGREYALELALRPRTPDDRALSSALEWFAQPSTAGDYRFKMQGRY